MPYINKSTLAYPATGAFPNGIWEDTRDPTSNDFKNFNPGVIWINFHAQKGWIMVDKTATSGSWIQMASTGSGILDITGNSGGAVGADLANNINLIGSGGVLVTGTPVNNTLTITAAGTVPLQFDEDTGSAVPSGNIIDIKGGTAITTSGSGHTVTITAGNSLATLYTEDSGTATPSSHNLNIFGGTGISTAGSGATVTISTSTAVATTYTENSGSATAAAHNLNILGTGGLTTSGAGSTVTVTTNGTLATLYTEDSGTATPAAGNLNISGGTGIATSGAGATVTVATTPAVATSYNGDSGTAIPAAHVLNITTGNATDRCGSSVKFTGSGSTLQLSVTDANNNTLIGLVAGNATLSGIGNTACGLSMLQSLTTGQFNAGLGYQALASVTSGSNNTAMGVSALAATTGDNNSAMGTNVLYQLVGGSYNSAFGNFAGRNYTGNESSNIVISNNGVLGESNVIRIGTQGAGNAQQNKCFIAGIFGVTVGASGTNVVVDNAGQLGTIVSSQRYKKNIVSMGQASSAIYDLKPRLFNYKSEANPGLQVGLIAEEVEEVMPNLVVYNKKGQPETVKYMDLPVLLLNELIKIKAEVDSLKKRVAELE